MLIEVDLRQAESRYVAWDAPEPTLMQMYQDGVDIHRYVASQPELFDCLPEAVTKDQRQLGKKVGHAANYGVMAKTLRDSCLKEMNLDVPQAKAERMLEGYHRTFPGIRAWHRRIRDKVLRDRKLTTPFGRERYFYERPGDDLWKEAYAHCPQSAIPDVINHLILWMHGHAATLLQGHDSALFEVPEAQVANVLTRIRDQDAWNPRLVLTGGELRIPIEVKYGRVWGKLEEIFVG